MNPRFGVYCTPSGRWFVIDTDDDHVVFDTPHESIARQMCIDKQVQTGGRPVAPTLRCVACWDKGFIRDPDGGLAEPCSCGMPAAEAQRLHDDRLDYMREMRRLAKYAGKAG
jgi:hypothetical protein